MCQLAMRKKGQSKDKPTGFSILISKTLRAYECPVDVANLLYQLALWTDVLMLSRAWPFGRGQYPFQTRKLETPLVLASSVSNST